MTNESKKPTQSQIHKEQYTKLREVLKENPEFLEKHSTGKVLRRDDIYLSKDVHGFPLEIVIGPESLNMKIGVPSYHTAYSGNRIYQVYNYKENIRPVSQVLGFLGYSLINLEANDLGSGVLIKADNGVHGFCSKLIIANGIVLDVDGAYSKLPDLKTNSKKLKQLKASRKAVKPSLDMLVTADILAEIGKNYPVDKYQAISQKAVTLRDKLSGLMTAEWSSGGTSVTPQHSSIIESMSCKLIAVDHYIKALDELTKSEDKITQFMEHTLPVMAGVFGMLSGSHGYRYPTLKGLQEIVDGRLSTRYGVGSGSVKKFVRGVDRLAEFIDDNLFTYRKVTAWDKRPVL